MWSDRILGQSVDISFPNRSVWVCNGNNIKLGSDLPRRTFFSHIDAKEAKPWERETFIHPNLVSWTKTNRGSIICAVLTVVRGWILAGAPKWKRSKGQKILGGFESWCNIIGGIFDYAGIDGFLTNQQSVYEKIDTDTPQWSSFFEVWYQKFGQREMIVSEICEHMLSEENIGIGLISNTGDNESLLSVLPELLSNIPV